MAYENITIGTEQELRNVFLAIKNEDESKVEPEVSGKIILSIYNADETEKLVDVTADTYAGKIGGFYVFQLELRTTKAGSNDMAAWERRREAIKLFVEQIVLKAGERQYAASGFSVTLSALSPEGGHQYVCKGAENDGRSFFFKRKEGTVSITFFSQLTIGIEYADLVKEFKQGALNDKKGWDMLWFKDCSQELYDPLELIKTTEEEKFFYSYICSVFDYSVNVYIRMNPEDDNFIDENRNSSHEKDMWHVLPRSKVTSLLKYFKKNNNDVYAYFRRRHYQNDTMPEKTKENRIYEEIAARFWQEYDAGQFQDADFLLRAGVIGNTGNQFLFEYRSVLNSIPNVYEDSGMYIYRPV